MKKKLDFQITNINGALRKIRRGKIYNFSLTVIGKKRKASMTEPIESVIIRGQQKFELHDVLNPIEIEINDDRIINLLKKHKNVYYKVTPISLLFPSSIPNDTRQIFLTCRELNDTKKLLIKFSLLGIIDLNKINSWENFKEKSLWVNTSFKEVKEKKSEERTCFSFLTSALNDLLNFCMNLIDHKNQQISFTDNENKISILNFQEDDFLR